jgi:hypothetical protein
MNRILWTCGLPAIVVVVFVIFAFARHGSADAKPNPTQEPESAAGVEPARAADAMKPDSAKAGATKPAETAPATAAPVKNPLDDRRVLLETVGTLTAVHAFQTYLNIGLIADGKAKGSYTDRDARKVLDSVLRLQDSVDQKLASVGKTELAKDDRDSLEDMRTVSDLLRKQAHELETYWDSGKEADEARYEEVRKDSWAALNRLMGGR